MLKNADVIGFGAGGLTTFAFLPQAIKVYKTNETTDLSEKTYKMLLLGIILWVIYGLIIKSICLIGTNLLQIGIVIYILIKIRRNKKSYIKSLPVLLEKM